MSRRGNKKMVSTYLTPEMKERLEKLAKSEGRSLSNYIEQLIKEKLKIELTEAELEELLRDE